MSNIEFREITIDDRQFVEQYLKAYQSPVSEMGFSNLFMWKDFYHFRFAVLGGLFCGVANPDVIGPFAFMPAGGDVDKGFTEAMEGLQAYFRQQGWAFVFRGIAEEELGCFKSHFGETGCRIELDRDDSDYVYLREDLADLPGKRYDGKRNHIRRFMREYSYRYIPMTPDLVKHCFPIMDRWCAQRDCEKHKMLYCEKKANTLMLENFEQLGLKGALIEVDGEYRAFTVGEMHTKDTAVIHLEKADSEFQGLYPFINQQFCQQAWPDVAYINREQDLGIEGLRKAKLSYHPVKMINKYNIWIG